MIKRYIGWNLLGMIAPAISAILLFPLLLEKVGTSTFGVLVLVWSLVGVAVLFDFGVGKSLTHKLSTLKGSSSEHEALFYIKAGEKISLYVCAVLFISLPILSLYYFKGDNDFGVGDIFLSVCLVTLIVIMQVYSSLYRGINEAHLNFKEINIIRGAVGVINFLGPYTLSFFTEKIFILIMPLFIARLTSLYFLRRCAKKSFLNSTQATRLEYGPATDKNFFHDLLRFGGWLTLSNISVMLMLQSDRFIIGSLLGVDSIPVYALPYELIIKCMMVIGAVTSALFPLLARYSNTSQKKLNATFSKWLVFCFLGVGTPLVLIYANIGSILSIWLITPVPELSIEIAKVLLIGVLINIVSAFQYCYLQALSKMNKVGLYQLLQTPIIIFLIFNFLNNFGLIGAAYVWVLRVVMDFTVYSIFMAQAGFSLKVNLKLKRRTDDYKC